MLQAGTLALGLLGVAQMGAGGYRLHKAQQTNPTEISNYVSDYSNLSENEKKGIKGLGMGLQSIVAAGALNYIFRRKQDE